MADHAITLHINQAQHYRRIGKEFADQQAVDQGNDRYARYAVPRVVVTSNTVEGFFSIFERGMRGVYQHCSEQHLHRYLAEFDFCYSNRIALGMDAQERTARALIGAKGKRLTYAGPSRHSN